MFLLTSVEWPTRDLLAVGDVYGDETESICHEYTTWFQYRSLRHSTLKSVSLLRRTSATSIQTIASVVYLSWIRPSRRSP